MIINYSSLAAMDSIRSMDALLQRCRRWISSENWPWLHHWTGIYHCFAVFRHNHSMYISTVETCYITNTQAHSGKLLSSFLFCTFTLLFVRLNNSECKFNANGILFIYDKIKHFQFEYGNFSCFMRVSFYRLLDIVRAGL